MTNGRWYQRRAYVCWCKYHNEFIILTSLYPYLVFKRCFHDVFPQLSVHPSTYCTRTYTLFSDPIRFFYRMHPKKQWQTNRHPSIDRHSRRGQPLPPSMCLISTCALIPSLREAVGPLPLLLVEVCPLLRAGTRCQCLRQYTVHVGFSCNLN